MNDAYAVTLDMDWAPDFIIAAVAEELVSRNVRATWFVTHDSPGVRRLLDLAPLFEFGLHPDFRRGSSHGRDEHQVLRTLRSILPDSRIMRTHALVQSTPLLQMAAREFNIEIDVSLFLPGVPNLRPFRLHLSHDGPGLLRVPYFWEDDIESYSPSPDWTFDNDKLHVSGLKVFNFHPVHVYLNSECMDRYNRLKQIGLTQHLSKDAVHPYVNRHQAGTRTLFCALLDHIRSGQERSYTISDIAETWEAPVCATV